MKNLLKRAVFVQVFSVFTLFLQADFSVSVNKQVDTTKDQKITAKIDGEQKLIEGLFKVTPSLERAGNNTLDITWTSILDKKTRTAVNNLVSTLDIKSKFIKRGTSILVKGSLPNSSLSSSKDDKKKEEKRDYNPASSTNISSGASSPVDNPVDDNSGELITPDYITSYDGCLQEYDSEKEIIHAYSQTYYFDNEGKRVSVEDCHQVKDYPAEKKDCEVYNDFVNHVTYERYQPYFIEDEKEYAAGGCVPSNSYPHQIDFSQCPAVAVGEEYIKQGMWYYQEENGEKIYISGCVLDPTGEEEDLLIQFEGCPVTHDIEHNQSNYLGRYYYINEANEKEYLGDCVETSQSYFPEQLRWNEGEWEHFNDLGYSQRVMTRYIVIPQEGNREEIIDDDELEPVHYQQTVVFSNTYKNYDDLDRGAPKGYSNKIMNKVVTYEGINYPTGESSEGESIQHVVIISGNPLRTEDCGHARNVHYYNDEVQRPDKSTYWTDEYDNGCEKND